MNVLVIAPTTDLANAPAEASEVAGHLRAVPLFGRVTKRDVLQRIAGQAWDVIWFITHGAQGGVVLSDGMLSVSELTQDIRQCGAKLAVLNTCESEVAGLQIHQELGVDVICTVGPADDAVALRTGAYLARNLAAGMPVKEAFERSKPGQNRLYRLFTAPMNDQNLPELLNQWGAMLRDEIRRVEQRTDRIERKVDEVERRFDERADKLDASLRQQMEQGLENMRASFQPRLTRRHTVQWLVGFILFMTASYAMVAQVHGALWLSNESLLLYGVVLYPISGFLFVSGLGMTWKDERDE